MAGRIVLVLAILLSGASADAYRPFDSTDADIADRGEVEIELGPVGYSNEDGTEFLVAPDAVANVGVLPRLELVLEGKGLVPLDSDAPDRRYRIVDTAFLAKGLVRRGSLQGERGPSLAVELGVDLPTLRDDPGWGGEGTAVLSQHFAYVTAHLNGSAGYTRDENWELGAGLILEGPARWHVRPVGEATFAREFDEANAATGLLGLIWEPRGDLAFDLGFRYARDDGHDIREIRAGVTWRFDLGWEVKEAR